MKRALHLLQTKNMKEQTQFDVIIIGGSYSGLSAAMSLGRALRKVLIIDNGKPCNRTAPHSHNFITQDGKPPRQIADDARAQVEKYNSIQFYKGLATKAEKTTNGFTVETESGKSFHTKKLLFATGLKDIMPNIKGFAECWGISIIHCPYCHGYEVRNEPTGIIGNGEAAFHYAWLISNWTKDLTIFTNGKYSFTEEQNQKLKANNLKVIETEIGEIIHSKGQLKHVELKDGKSVKLNAIYHGPSFEQHCKLPQEMGCEITESGHIQVTLFQQTSVEGIFAAGDNSTMMRSLASAVAAGTTAGAFINNELTQAEF
ncbi:NAD(P)/FAD-dependent oxidoreductase [Owenweeksia hongkongensis]|uniref:NAD(P)/FAD-dependent oxidoreductase n=1 Tax=Owenweeksia hongkongensis TaxID=253245 RepID=UPI003A8E1E0E